MRWLAAGRKARLFIAAAIAGLVATLAGVAYAASLTLAPAQMTAVSLAAVPPAPAFSITGITFGGTVNGKPETNDTMTLTFSGTVKATTVPTTPTVTFSRASNSVDTFVTIGGIFGTSVDTGGQGYFTQSGNRAASFASTVSVSGSTITIKLGKASGDTVSTGSSGTTNVVSVTPANTITDTGGNAASGTFSTGANFAFF